MAPARERKNECGWLRHRWSNCDSYLIHGYVECILYGTTYEYRSIGQRGATVAKEIIAAPSRVYDCINYVDREPRHITEETAARGTRAVEGNNALGFIERAPATGFARIRGTPRRSITICMINRRFVSAVPSARINSRTPFSGTGGKT